MVTPKTNSPSNPEAAATLNAMFPAVPIDPETTLARAWQQALDGRAAAIELGDDAPIIILLSGEDGESLLPQNFNPQSAFSAPARFDTGELALTIGEQTKTLTADNAGYDAFRDSLRPLFNGGENLTFVTIPRVVFNLKS